MKWRIFLVFALLVIAPLGLMAGFPTGEAGLGSTGGSPGPETFTTGYHIKAPVIGDEPAFTIYAIAAFTIDGARADTASGTVDYSVQINGVDVTGIASVQAGTGTTSTLRAATANNEVAVGDKVTVEVIGVTGGTEFGIDLVATQ